MSARYWLSREWVICCTTSHVVCLNLRKGGSRVLEASHSNALCRIVTGWPQIPPQSVPEQPSVQISGLLSSLMQEGVLVNSRRLGKDPTPVSVPRVTGSLGEEYLTHDAAINTLDVIRFMRAATAAGFLLHMSELRCYAHLQRSQKSASSTHWDLSSTSDSDAENLRITFSKFLRLRPLLWKPSNQEWFERLVLFKFFQYNGARPAFILGVSAEPPFEALCWFQHGDLSVDTIPALISGFVPIAAV